MDDFPLDYSNHESSADPGSSSEFGIGSDAVMSPFPPSFTDPSSSSQAEGIQLWPLVMHNGQMMQITPNPLVPLEALPALPQVEQNIVGWAPANSSDNSEAFFSYPQFWPYDAVPSVPSSDLVSQTLQNIAEHQQYAHQLHSDSAALYDESMACSSLQDCSTEAVPVFASFPVYLPQSSEEGEEHDNQVQVQQNDSMVNISTQHGNADLQMLAELAVALNQQEEQAAALSGNTN